MIYDVLIIGGGPAGYTAALYAARAGLKTAVLEKLCAGGQMALAAQIHNYPGFPNGIDGVQLAGAMREAAEKAGASTFYTEAGNLIKREDFWALDTDLGKLSGRTIIVAAGAEPRKLGLPDEQAFIGKGVSYCATCDGAFYRNKTVAVVGGGNSALSEALHLSKICAKVYLIHRRNVLRASKAEQDLLRDSENVELLLNSSVTGISGTDLLSEITVFCTDGQSRRLACEGLFISIGRAPASDPFRNILPLDSNGYILADNHMETGIPGIFAAGDIRSGSCRQIITAAADGAIAAISAEKYLSSNEKAGNT